MGGFMNIIFGIRAGRTMLGWLAMTLWAGLALVPPTAAAQTADPYTMTGGTSPGAAPAPWFLTFNDAGNLLAVVNLPLDGTSTSKLSISMFSVGGNGFLTPAPGSPFPVDGVVNSVAFNAAGTLLAATNGLNSFVIYSVGPNGELSFLSKNSTETEVTIPMSVDFSPTGNLLAVAYGANVVGTYAISPSGGATLVGVGFLPTGASPQTVAFHPSGAWLVTANASTDNVTMFSVAPHGALSLVGSFSTGVGSGPVAAVFSPNGQWLATANEATEQVGMFSMASNGALTQVSGSPFAASPSTPNSATRDIRFHPSGNLLAVANPGAHTVRLMSVAANGALATVQDIYPAFGAVSAAFSPSGTFLAAAHAALQMVVMYTVGPPKVTFATPAAGAKIGPALPTFPVLTSFTCSDAPYGPGIASCVDEEGNPAGTPLDTSVPGSRTFTVTATSVDGRSTTSSIDYTVIQGPSTAISSPADGGIYRIGEVVPTSFSCAAAPDGPLLVFCSDSNGVTGSGTGQTQGSGTGALKTDTAGVHTYTVNACAGVFCSGGWSRTSITYTVIEAPAETVLAAPAVPAGALVGTAVTATTTLARTDELSSGVAGQPVVFTWTLPGGATTTQSATTDADGTASVSFTPAIKGAHTVSVSFAGTGALLGSTSDSATLGVYQRTTLQLPATAASAGQAVTLAATLSSMPDGAPLAGQTVTFSFSGAGAPAAQTAVTDGGGVASVSVVFATPGTVSAQASFLNAAAFYTNGDGALPAAATTASALVSVTDTTPPVMASHPDIDVVATGPAGASVIYTAPASHDDVSGDLATVCTPPSGSTFPIGSTLVTCTASDAAGNSASTSFTVTVAAAAPVDTTAPVVTYTGNAGTYGLDQTIAITCTATDADSGVVATTCADITGPAYRFGIGTHTFSATATDAAGNVGHGSITFTVRATPASLPALVSQLVTNPGVAAGLNAKLAAAARAPNARARVGQLGAFANQLRGQVGRTMTAADAAVLMALVDALY